MEVKIRKQYLEKIKYVDILCPLGGGSNNTFWLNEVIMKEFEPLDLHTFSV